jgi:Mg-chelatase subunit ChlD
MTGMQITSACERVKVSTHQINITGQQEFDFKVLVRVEAPPVVKKRLPIDLVAVLDISGSMGLAAAPPAKKPSRLDLVKKAMKIIIMHLNDDDRLAIVAFNNKVVSEYSTDILDIADGRVSAERKVDELVAKGDTAFKPGLEHAVKVRPYDPLRDR